ncbi:MAG: hypothetical protein AB9897_00210 [Anaerolineaceae bacterium]
MPEHGGRRPKTARIIKSAEERVKRVSFTLPIDVADFLRAQKNANLLIIDLVHQEMKKREFPSE